MATYEAWRSRAPRFRWETIVVLFSIFIRSFLQPFLSDGSAVTPFMATVATVVFAVALLALSLVFDVTPSVVSRREADYQNLHARDLYALPVFFQAVPTAVPGFSRLRATRTDLNQSIGVWTLRMHHGRRPPES